MSDTPETPKKGFDLADFHRSTLEEMEIEPLGRVLVGLFTIGAMTELEKAQAKKEGISDLDLVRVLFRSVVEIPLVSGSWEGRPITELELARVPEDQLEVFAAAGLSRPHWKVDSESSENESEPYSSAIGVLARRVRSHLEQMERLITKAMGPLPDYYSDSTRTLFRETERMSRLANLERPLQDTALSKFLDNHRAINKAIQALQPTSNASEILRRTSEMARPFGSVSALNQIPELKIPHIPSMADYVGVVSKEGRETREQIGKLNSLMELTNQLFHSALADNEKKHRDDTRRWRRDFYLALTGVLIAACMGIGSIFFTHFSGKVPGQRQELMLKALQEQNAYLAELVGGQKRLEPRSPAPPPRPEVAQPTKRKVK